MAGKQRTKYSSRKVGVAQENAEKFLGVLEQFNSVVGDEEYNPGRVTERACLVVKVAKDLCIATNKDIMKLSGLNMMELSDLLSGTEISIEESKRTKLFENLEETARLTLG